MPPLVIYVAGPYSGPDQDAIDRNVAAAAAVGQEIMRLGHVALVPHTMTHNWDHGTGLVYKDFIRCDLALLRCCNAICMVDGWESSPGAVGELHEARRLVMPVYMGVEEVPWADER